ncbi:MAG: type II toxin-antitoxin system PemK/MazF family toxin [Clostridia bacterium]|nr:type II toxin-antitoxin system PemK/MazF family toxin [Clostridia bacterium]
MKRGDIYYADLGKVVGSEQSGIRPVVVVQNNLGNKYSNTVIVLPITSRVKKKLPTHVSISKNKYGLEKDSIILVEQIRTLDKSRLKERIGRVDKKVLDEIKNAVIISCDLRGNASFLECLKFFRNM